MAGSTKLDLNKVLGRNPNTAISEPPTPSYKDQLPPFRQLDIQLKDPPKLPPELIQGVLYCGQTMMVTGASKAGKSFLLMELSIAIATGGKWLGFQCKKGKVLYVNFEIAEASFCQRYAAILEAMNVQRQDVTNLNVWNLRGLNVNLEKLVNGLNARMEDREYIAIILDPIYKVLDGDENNTETMRYFCEQLDAICTSTGSSVIFCHHQTKGNQAKKNAIDRGAGSGLLARNADALLDLLALEPPIRQMTETHGHPFRVEATCRNFGTSEPFNIWFKYPLHNLDTDNLLNHRPVSGSPDGNLSKSVKRSKKLLEDVFDNCKDNLGYATIESLTKALECSERTIHNRVRESKGKYVLEDKKVRLAG